MYLVIPLAMLVVLFTYFVPLTSVQIASLDYGSALCQPGDKSPLTSKYHFHVSSQRREYSKLASYSGNLPTNLAKNVPSCQQERYELFL